MVDYKSTDPQERRGHATSRKHQPLVGSVDPVQQGIPPSDYNTEDSPRPRTERSHHDGRNSHQQPLMGSVDPSRSPRPMTDRSHHDGRNSHQQPLMGSVDPSRYNTEDSPRPRSDHDGRNSHQRPLVGSVDPSRYNTEDSPRPRSDRSHHDGRNSHQRPLVGSVDPSLYNTEDSALRRSGRSQPTNDGNQGFKSGSVRSTISFGSRNFVPSIPMEEIHDPMSESTRGSAQVYSRGYNSDGKLQLGATSQFSPRHNLASSARPGAPIAATSSPRLTASSARPGAPIAATSSPRLTPSSTRPGIPIAAIGSPRLTPSSSRSDIPIAATSSPRLTASSTRPGAPNLATSAPRRIIVAAGADGSNKIATYDSRVDEVSQRHQRTQSEVVRSSPMHKRSRSLRHVKVKEKIKTEENDHSSSNSSSSNGGNILPDSRSVSFKQLDIGGFGTLKLSEKEMTQTIELRHRNTGKQIRKSISKKQTDNMQTDEETGALTRRELLKQIKDNEQQLRNAFSQLKELRLRASETDAKNTQLSETVNVLRQNELSQEIVIEGLRAEESTKLKNAREAIMSEVENAIDERGDLQLNDLVPGTLREMLEKVHKGISLRIIESSAKAMKKHLVMHRAAIETRSNTEFQNKMDRLHAEGKLQEKSLADIAELKYQISMTIANEETEKLMACNIPLNRSPKLRRGDTIRNPSRETVRSTINKTVALTKSRSRTKSQGRAAPLASKRFGHRSMSSTFGKSSGVLTSSSTSGCRTDHPVMSVKSRSGKGVFVMDDQVPSDDDYSYDDRSSSARRRDPRISKKRLEKGGDVYATPRAPDPFVAAMSSIFTESSSILSSQEASSEFGERVRLKERRELFHTWQQANDEFNREASASRPGVRGIQRPPAAPPRTPRGAGNNLYTNANALYTGGRQRYQSNSRGNMTWEGGFIGGHQAAQAASLARPPAPITNRRRPGVKVTTAIAMRIPGVTDDARRLLRRFVSGAVPPWMQEVLVKKHSQEYLPDFSSTSTSDSSAVDRRDVSGSETKPVVSPLASIRTERKEVHPPARKSSLISPGQDVQVKPKTVLGDKKTPIASPKPKVKKVNPLEALFAKKAAARPSSVTAEKTAPTSKTPAIVVKKSVHKKPVWMPPAPRIPAVSNGLSAKPFRWSPLTNAKCASTLWECLALEGMSLPTADSTMALIMKHLDPELLGPAVVTPRVPKQLQIFGKPYWENPTPPFILSRFQLDFAELESLFFETNEEVERRGKVARNKKCELKIKVTEGVLEPSRLRNAQISLKALGFLEPQKMSDLRRVLENLEIDERRIDNPYFPPISYEVISILIELFPTKEEICLLQNPKENSRLTRAEEVLLELNMIDNFIYKAEAIVLALSFDVRLELFKEKTRQLAKVLDATLDSLDHGVLRVVMTQLVLGANFLAPPKTKNKEKNEPVLFYRGFDISTYLQFDKTHPLVPNGMTLLQSIIGQLDRTWPRIWKDFEWSKGLRAALRISLRDITAEIGGLQRAVMVLSERINESKGDIFPPDMDDFLSSFVEVANEETLNTQKETKRVEDNLFMLQAWIGCEDRTIGGGMTTLGHINDFIATIFNARDTVRLRFAKEMRIVTIHRRSNYGTAKSSLKQRKALRQALLEDVIKSAKRRNPHDEISFSSSVEPFKVEDICSVAELQNERRREYSLLLFCRRWQKKRVVEQKKSDEAFIAAALKAQKKRQSKTMVVRPRCLPIFKPLGIGSGLGAAKGIPPGPPPGGLFDKWISPEWAGRRCLMADFMEWVEKQQQNRNTEVTCGPRRCFALPLHKPLKKTSGRGAMKGIPPGGPPDLRPDGEISGAVKLGRSNFSLDASSNWIQPPWAGRLSYLNELEDLEEDKKC